MAVDVRLALAKLGVKDFRVDGDRAWAPCPFHGASDDAKWIERFRARQEQGTFFVRLTGARRGQSHCFSCKEGGSLADLTMHVIGIGYRSALDWLAQWEGTEPLPKVPARIRLSLPGDDVFRLPACVEWGVPIDEWVTPLRRYVETRGLTSQVERWGFGFAVSGWLAGRIVIPVHDSDDELVNFMARTISEDPGVRRYLNAKNEDHPDLDAVFGERRWPMPELRERTSVVVAEGAINALAAERAGAKTIAALAGSDVRPLHVAKLMSFGRVVLITDNDPAGNSAAAQLGAALARHREVHRVSLPPNVDAAQLPREELAARLAAAGV